MNTSHTKGPWNWEFNSTGGNWVLYGANDEHCSLVGPPDMAITPDQRLSAAAPDLLEALEKIADFTTGYDDVAGIVCGIARAAIAKAAL